MSPEVIASLDAIKVNMNEAGMNAINIVLAFVMFGVSLGIKPKTFLDVVKKPQSVVLGILCQLLLLPALTFLLTITFDGWISPMIALGMILVASCPGGNISNFITSLSRGNTEHYLPHAPGAPVQSGTLRHVHRRKIRKFQAVRRFGSKTPEKRR